MGNEGLQRETLLQDPRACAVRKRRALVVEDDIDAATALAAMLRMWGLEVVVAHDGIAAIAEAARLPPDIVILDLGLPILDGYTVAARMRADGAHMPLVALSGYGGDEDRERALRAGFDEFMLKPVEPDALRRTLDALPGAPD